MPGTAERRLRACVNIRRMAIRDEMALNRVNLDLTVPGAAEGHLRFRQTAGQCASHMWPDDKPTLLPSTQLGAGHLMSIVVLCFFVFQFVQVHLQNVSDLPGFSRSPGVHVKPLAL